jgi:hypothetical protein
MRDVDTMVDTLDRVHSMITAVRLITLFTIWRCLLTVPAAYGTSAARYAAHTYIRRRPP